MQEAATVNGWASWVAAALFAAAGRSAPAFANSFVDIQAGLLDVTQGNAVWGDYDSDGDLDVLLTGFRASGNVSTIYRNDGGGAFSDVLPSLTAVTNADAAWGDYDGDGDLDIALTGQDGLTRTSRIYRNDSGDFVDIVAGLAGVGSGSLDWGDYDSDGDLDLALVGLGAEPVSRLYRNDGGSFASLSIAVPGHFGGSLEWGDYDNDGDPDLTSGSELPGRSRETEPIAVLRTIAVLIAIRMRRMMP